MNAAGKEPRSLRRARLIREGKSWRSACLEAGYSINTANRGPKAYFRDSPGTQKEFIRLAQEEPYPPDLARKMAKHRLTSAIAEGKSSNVSREIELLGKFKEYDWWVRNSDVQVGIFPTLCDPEIDWAEEARALKAYEDETGGPSEPPGKQSE